MYTLRSSSHKPFWCGGFLKIILADLLVCTSFYMFLPLFPELLWGSGTPEEQACLYAGLLFCAGVLLPAPCCNYWMDVYRRKGVALRALACFTVVVALMQLGLPLWVKLLSWFLAGSAWSVFQIALGSTLLLDLSQSEQRTEAAHIYYWFSRLALVFGTLLARLVPVRDAGYSYLLLSLAFLVAAWLLVFSLSVPFRAPLNPPLFSLDRFWLPRGVRLFLPVLLVSAFAGLSLGCVREAESGLFLGAGFLTALIVHRHLFKDGMQAEVISGFVLLLVSCAVFGWFSESYAGRSVSVCVLGAGLGFTASRFLLAFIRICEHCERGTAQTSCWLGWEIGLVSGFMLAFALRENHRHALVLLSVIFVVSAFFSYLFGVRKWYVAHRRK